MLLSSFILFEWWRNFVLSECWRKCLPDLVLIRCPTWDLLVVVMQILNQHRRIKIDTESVFIPEKVRMWCTDACCAGLLAFSVVCLWWQFIFYVRSNGLVLHSSGRLGRGWETKCSQNLGIVKIGGNWSFLIMSPMVAKGRQGFPRSKGDPRDGWDEF